MCRLHLIRLFVLPRTTTNGPKTIEKLSFSIKKFDFSIETAGETIKKFSFSIENVAKTIEKIIFSIESEGKLIKDLAKTREKALDF